MGLPLQILPEFFKHFWVRRMALDRRNYRALVETTVEIASKVTRARAGMGATPPPFAACSGPWRNGHPLGCTPLPS